jgi:hypothetical protein
VVVVGGSILGGVAMTIRSGDLQWLFLSLPFTGIFWFASRLAPTGYRLGADGVHVERRGGGRAIIPYDDIRLVDQEPRSVKGLTFAGSNGLFGRFGSFWNPRLGFYRLFLSNTNSVVWLATGRGWVALSPDRPEEFRARLEPRIRGSRREAT